MILGGDGKGQDFNPLACALVRRRLGLAEIRVGKEAKKWDAAKVFEELRAK